MDTFDSLSIADTTISNKLPTLKQAALQYAERNCQVLPLWWLKAPGVCACSEGKDCTQGPGKHPLTSNGLLDATRNPAQVEVWWSAWPQAHIGIRTGKASGFDVLDVDMHAQNGQGALAAFVAEHGPLQPTVEARTGGGGTHYLFKHQDGVGSTTGLLPGVDVRGEPGYIVAAPSAHKSGNYYEWVNEPGTVELAEWPPALLALMATRKHKDTATMQGATVDSTPTVVSNVEAYVSKALQNTAETVATTPSGQWHDALLKAATSVGRLQEYVGKDRATAALTGAVGAWGVGVNDADTQTIADGLAYGVAHPKLLRVGAAASGAAASGAAASGAAASGATASGAEATESRKLFQIQPLSDFEHVPPQKWLIEGVLIEDSLAFMFGLPDCYKSFCAQAMAYAMYNGTPWYDKATVQGNVLYIAAEGVRTRATIT